MIRREGDLSRGIPDRENISRESSLLRFLIVERTIGYPKRLKSNTQKAWRNFSYKISNLSNKKSILTLAYFTEEFRNSRLNYLIHPSPSVAILINHAIVRRVSKLLKTLQLRKHASSGEIVHSAHDFLPRFSSIKKQFTRDPAFEYI